MTRHPRPALIGLIGKAGAGKDTVAEMLEPYGFVRVAFADALKQAAYHSDPLIDVGYGDAAVRLSAIVDAHGWDAAKRVYPDVRRYLQRYGVAMRDALPGCWVNIAMQYACELLDDGRHVVVTDVRFPDEADAIRAERGTVARIIRPAVADLGANAADVSETTLDGHPADYQLNNDRGLPDLVDKVRRLNDYALGKAINP